MTADVSSTDIERLAENDPIFKSETRQNKTTNMTNDQKLKQDC